MNNKSDVVLVCSVLFLQYLKGRSETTFRMRFSKSYLQKMKIHHQTFEEADQGTYKYTGTVLVIIKLT